MCRDLSVSDPDGLATTPLILPHLTRYLNSYLKAHGLRGPVSSVFISKNASASFHKDSHNCKDSLNWTISLGNYRGGKLWVENSSSDASAKDLVGVRGREILRHGIPVASCSSRSELGSSAVAAAWLQVMFEAMARLVPHVVQHCRHARRRSTGRA